MWWSTRLFLINIIPSLYFRLILVQARHGGPWSFILGGGSDIILTAICVLIAASVQARTRTRVPSIAPTLLWWLYNMLRPPTSRPCASCPPRNRRGISWTPISSWRP